MSRSVITKKCAFMMDMEGKPQPFSSSDASKLVNTVIEPMAMDGLRTIGIAYKDFVTGKACPTFSRGESGQVVPRTVKSWLSRSTLEDGIYFLIFSFITIQVVCSSKLFFS